MRKAFNWTELETLTGYSKNSLLYAVENRLLLKRGNSRFPFTLRDTNSFIRRSGRCWNLTKCKKAETEPLQNVVTLRNGIAVPTIFDQSDLRLFVKRANQIGGTTK